MSSTRRFHAPLLVTSLLCCAAPAIAAPGSILDALSKGSEWRMRINSQTGTLRLIGGDSRMNASGGYDLKFQVSWGGIEGALQGTSDAPGGSRRVALVLRYPGGKSLRCEGSLAGGGNDMMAGTCGKDGTAGAWYATRAATDLPGDTQAAGPDDAQPLPSAELSSAVARADRLQGHLTEVSAELRAERMALHRCRQEQASPAGGGCQPPSISAISSQLTGQHDLPADGAISTAFPEPPGSGSRLARFLALHRGGLLTVLRTLYPEPEITRYLAQEQSKCEGSIYCQVTLLQQALQAALAGARRGAGS